MLCGFLTGDVQCLQRWRKVLAPGLKKGRWTAEEDELLRARVSRGFKNWGEVAQDIPGRTFKQCPSTFSFRRAFSRIGAESGAAQTRTGPSAPQIRSRRLLY